METFTKEEIMEIANQFIDENFPTPLGNKKNYELNDRQAVERTMIFAGAYGRGLTDAIMILKS